MGSCVISFSNYSYEPSLSSRFGAGKAEIEDAEVFAIVARKVESMIESAVQWKSKFPDPRHAQILVGNSLEMNPVCGPGVTLVLTSPPYLNNYHYVRNSRPQLYLLDLISEMSQLKYLQSSNFGGYWQELRNGPDIQPQFTSPLVKSAIASLAAVNRREGTYSGKGWARYATTYFNDSKRLLQTLKDFLPDGAHIVLVLGNSIIQGEHFAVDRMVADIATEVEMHVEGIATIRKRDQGNKLMTSSVRSFQSEIPLYEAMVVIKKQSRS